MPELAEVEYYRRQWDSGLGGAVVGVALHREKRIFRGLNVTQLERLMAGTVFERSAASGKQLLFRFSAPCWLGLHMGMTGKLSAAVPDFTPDKHDHLVLYQKERALVFSDSRLFGRVQFHGGAEEPEWWSKLPPAVDAPGFTSEKMHRFLESHRQLAIKPTLLLQAGFAGIGNWMADEILWRARIHPKRHTGDLTVDERRALWRSLRFVTRGAMRHVSPAFADPPRGWLFHERWSAGGRCPIHRTPLSRETIAGRTSAWCDKCQR